jgi:hypothetical protein
MAKTFYTFLASSLTCLLFCPHFPLKRNVTPFIINFNRSMHSALSVLRTILQMSFDLALIRIDLVKLSIHIAA